MKTLFTLTACTWLFIAGQHEGYNRAVRDIDNQAFAGYVNAARATRDERHAQHVAAHHKHRRQKAGTFAIVDNIE